MKINNKEVQSFKQSLEKPGKTLLMLHKNPDGDSLGSNLALAEVLKKFGHDVTISSRDKVPDYLMFLPGADAVQVLPESGLNAAQYETFMALDMSALDMLGVAFVPSNELNVICIDHHITNAGWGTCNLIDVEAISTASILTTLFQQIGVEITPTMAQNLFTGLATDSGFFRYSKDANSFKIAAKLIESGADYASIVYEINKQVDVSDYQFVGVALARLELNALKKAAIITIPNELWEKYCKIVDRGYMLKSYLQNIKDTDFGLLLTEESPGVVKVSLRARTKGFDVARIAKAFGGGGHIAAAGAIIENVTVDEAKKMVLETV